MTAELQKNHQQQMSPESCDLQCQTSKVVVCWSPGEGGLGFHEVPHPKIPKLKHQYSPFETKSEPWNPWFIFLVSLRCLLRWSQPHFKMNYFYLIIKKIFHLSYWLYAYLTIILFFFFYVKLWLGYFTSVSSNPIPCKVWLMVSLSSLPP